MRDSGSRLGPSNNSQMLTLRVLPPRIVHDPQTLMSGPRFPRRSNHGSLTKARQTIRGALGGGRRIDESPMLKLWAQTDVNRRNATTRPCDYVFGLASPQDPRRAG